MGNTARVGLFLAMMFLTIVSIWTTYASLTDSILPTPVVPIPLPNGAVWEMSIFAMGLSLAIGLMLFAMKLAIVDEHKRLNAFGFIGLFIIACVSITFNMDIFYRTINKDFFLRHSASKVTSRYDSYLQEVKTALLAKQEELEKTVARQEGELEAETEGLRQHAAGYGPVAKQEDYRLTLLRKEAEVGIERINQALAAEEKADAILTTARPKTIEEVAALENELRVAVGDVGAFAGVPLPEPAQLESPFFAVFEKLFDFKTVGWMEGFTLLLAILVDLGDIVGYSMVPDHPKQKRRYATPDGGPGGAEFVAERLPSLPAPPEPRPEPVKPTPRDSSPEDLHDQGDGTRGRRIRFR